MKVKRHFKDYNKVKDGNSIREGNIKHKWKRKQSQRQYWSLPEHQAQVLLIPDDIILHGKHQVAQSSVHGVVIKVFLRAHISTRRVNTRWKSACRRRDLVRQSRKGNAIEWECRGTD